MRAFAFILFFCFSSLTLAADSPACKSTPTSPWTLNIPETFLGEYAGQINHSVFGQTEVRFALTKSAMKPSAFASFSILSENERQDAKASFYMNSVHYNPETNQIVARIEFQAKRDFGIIFNELVINLNSATSLTGTYQTNSFSSDGRLVQGTWTAEKIN